MLIDTALFIKRLSKKESFTMKGCLKLFILALFIVVLYYTLPLLLVLFAGLLAG